MQTLHTPYFDHTTSAVLVAVLSLAILGTLLGAIVQLFFHRGGAAIARAAAAGASRLAPGPAILRGTVATEGSVPAMTVRITQSGSQRTRRGKTSHTWSETSREVSVQPFELVLDGGERVLVEPSQDAFLVDALELAERPGLAERVVEARLSAGERAYVEGVLHRKRGAGSGADGYRGGGERWVLRPPAQNRMLLCAESLEERHERRQRFWTGFAAVVALVLAISQLVAFSLFWPIVVNGVTCEVEVSELRQYTTRGRRGSRHHHYVVEGTVRSCEGAPAADLGGRHVQDELGSGAFSMLHEGDRVPFVILPSDPTVHQIGRHAGLDRSVFFGVLVLFFFGVVFSYVAYRRSLAWYEQSRVKESGSGPL